MKRVFLIVLDSFGIGELPDAEKFGDKGTNTLGSISRSQYFSADNMKALGLGNIDGIDCIGEVDSPIGAYARMKEKSLGKDTTVGHWEIAGLISANPLPTYPEGFPAEIIDEFSKQTGRGVLCNKPYSGTDVIRDYGKQHMESGDLIVYTSADSVFQIAAHEDVVDVETLYEYCRIARKILCGRHGVGRVIARPFAGEYPFKRSAKRHDFSLEPTGETLLDLLNAAGKDVISVGKIYDIFAGRGTTESHYTHSNTEGMQKTLEIADRDFDGLCFVNLVDFDMMYGHRNDIDGYAKAIAEFDAWLPSFMAKMQKDDVLLITADHGCDPGYIQSTDHSREHTPFLMCGVNITPENYGTRETFSDIAATVAKLLEVDYNLEGDSLI
ncbi:MAG: phosphopentomutase [Ruminococcaceae bacterium]|nr:phosphopentomutase [Oscillospiraceae bacterium]